MTTSREITQRFCADCGKPTKDYRCPACTEQFKHENEELGEALGGNGAGPAPEPLSPEELQRLSRLSRRGTLKLESAAPEAFHGIAGEFVELVGPETEADPMALLVQFLAAVANAFGANPHVCIGADRHGAKLNAVLVGATSSGRKGSSLSAVERVVGIADPSWLACRGSNVGSGEVIPWTIRDAQTVTKAGKEVVEPGVDEKRLFLVAAEFAAVLAVAGKEGSTLSPILRDAWDRDSLRTMSKVSPAKATGAHVTVIGHITQEELRRSLTQTERANGFANRFLWIAVNRSKLLPRGGRIPDLIPLAARLRTAISFARLAGEVEHGGGFWDVFEPWYREHAEHERAGMAGAILGRAAPYVHRLAMVFALLDCSGLIERKHAVAALAVWDYAERSAVMVFGDSLGDPTADEILHTLREAAPNGVTRNDLREMFGRNRSVGPPLEALERLGLAVSRKAVDHATKGRPPEYWYAVVEGSPNAINARNAKSAGGVS